MREGRQVVRLRMVLLICAMTTAGEGSPTVDVHGVLNAELTPRSPAKRLVPDRLCVLSTQNRASALRHTYSGYKYGHPALRLFSTPRMTDWHSDQPYTLGGSVNPGSQAQGRCCRTGFVQWPRTGEVQRGGLFPFSLSNLRPLRALDER